MTSAERCNERLQADKVGVFEGLAITMDVEKEISREEAYRVGNNWAEHGDKFMSRLGDALLYGTLKQRRAIKAAFPDEWEQWDGEFDEHGRAI